MQDFIYHNPVKILFGHDQIPALAQEVFFEQLGVKTRLSDYDLGDEAIAEVIRKLKEHGHIALGEHGKITAREAEALLKMAL